jgi:hypothetical protein
MTPADRTNVPQWNLFTHFSSRKFSRKEEVGYKEDLPGKVV